MAGFRVSSAAVHRKTRHCSAVRGTGGETRACDRVRRRLVRARARAHPTRPTTTTRPPNSDLVRTASHVSRRPVDHDRATTQSVNAYAAAVYSASVSRPVSDHNNNIIIIIINDNQSWFPLHRSSVIFYSFLYPSDFYFVFPSPFPAVPRDRFTNARPLTTVRRVRGYPAGMNNY